MKTISPENWLTHDPMMEYFGAFSRPPNTSTAVGGARLVDQIRIPTLPADVPDGVRRLFEMARGALCYGCLFYPLYTLGAEQAYRCLDAALQSRLEVAKPEKRLRTFEDRIKWAKARGILTETEAERWDSVRHLRNWGSHSDGNAILVPGQAIHTLYVAADLISALFPNDHPAN